MMSTLLSVTIAGALKSDFNFNSIPNDGAMVDWRCSKRRMWSGHHPDHITSPDGDYQSKLLFLVA